VALRAALVVLVVGPLVLWLVRGPRRTWLLVAPLLLGLVVMQLQTLAVDFPFVQPRYLYALLPAFGIAAGLALVRSVGVRATAFAAGGVTLGVAGLWAYLGTVTPTIQ
jgi:hypothetical protein